MTALAGFFLLVGLGIFADLAFNEGEGLSSIFSAIRGRNTKIGEITIEDDKISFAKMLLEEIASLRDELTYEQSEEDKRAIVNKIEDRQKILDKLF